MKLRIEQLKAVVSSNLTSLSALTIVTGMTEARMVAILDDASNASEEEVEVLKVLLTRYEWAVRVANAHLARDRFSRI